MCRRSSRSFHRHSSLRWLAAVAAVKVLREPGVTALIPNEKKRTDKSLLRAERRGWRAAVNVKPPYVACSCAEESEPRDVCCKDNVKSCCIRRAATHSFKPCSFNSDSLASKLKHSPLSAFRRKYLWYCVLAFISEPWTMAMFWKTAAGHKSFPTFGNNKQPVSLMFLCVCVKLTETILLM